MLTWKTVHGNLYKYSKRMYWHGFMDMKAEIVEGFQKSEIRKVC